MEEDYILFNQVIVRSNDYVSKAIIFNNIELNVDDENINAKLNYNFTIGTSSDSLYKIKLYLNLETKELCIDNEDEKEYFIQDTDIILNLNKFFDLESNTTYRLIIEFITKLGSVEVKYYDFSFGDASKLKLKGKESDIKEKKTNKSYRSLDNIKIKNDLTGTIF